VPKTCSGSHPDHHRPLGVNIGTQAQDEHWIDSNDFDRAETGIKTIAAVHSQCH
jgi:hypothetical protein